MFGWFSHADDGKDNEIPRWVAPPMPDVAPPAPSASNWSVGLANDGRVQLMVGPATLTLTNVGVDTLVRMLEAAKQPDTPEDKEQE